MKIQQILNHFLDITILKIDSNGQILEEVINTKENFQPMEVENFTQIFRKNDQLRAQRLLKLGLESTKRFMEISTRFKVREYADVEIYTDEKDMYACIKFFSSKRDQEIETDRKMEKFAQMAELDPLTNLLNRYGYWERIQNTLLNADPDRKLGILLIDIDNLKTVNDSNGHKAGDRAINQISELISSSIRVRDIAVRYGGDEFVVVVEELTGKRSSAQGLANRLVNTIKKNKEDFLTTISIGVHVVTVKDFKVCTKTGTIDRKCWEKAVEIADKMAYEAKQAGKNRVVCSFK